MLCKAYHCFRKLNVVEHSAYSLKKFSKLVFSSIPFLLYNAPRYNSVRFTKCFDVPWPHIQKCFWWRRWPANPIYSAILRKPGWKDCVVIERWRKGSQSYLHSLSKFLSAITFNPLQVTPARTSKRLVHGKNTLPIFLFYRPCFKTPFLSPKYFSSSLPVRDWRKRKLSLQSL